MRGGGGGQCGRRGKSVARERSGRLAIEQSWLTHFAAAGVVIVVEVRVDVHLHGGVAADVRWVADVHRLVHFDGVGQLIATFHGLVVHCKF